MSTPRLLKIDESNLSDHYHLLKEDRCFFFYEYIAGKSSLPYTRGNSLIRNLKKELNKKETNEYHYKLEAIQYIGSLFNTIFKQCPKLLSQALVSPIPPSKVKEDPHYDDRMTQVCELACQDIKTTFCELIKQTSSYFPSHQQKAQERIKLEALKKIYQLTKHITQPVVILIDDLITAGTHYRACKEVIQKKHPDTRVIGLFIARRVLNQQKF